MASHKASRFVVGIDLGTTNCAVAYCDTGAPGASDEPSIQHLLIPHLVAPGLKNAGFRGRAACYVRYIRRRGSAALLAPQVFAPAQRG